MIYKLLEDDAGCLWGSTNHGIFRMDQEGVVRTYRIRDGLLCDQYNYSSGMFASDGRMYFGGVKGFVSFAPSRLHWSSFPAPLVFNQLLVYNEEVPIGGKDSPLEKSVTMTDHLVFHPSQSVFTIGFAELAFSTSSATEYEYRLEGFDRDWIRIPRPQPVTYSKLRPRKYQFQVRAIHPEASFPETSNHLDITVLPPFYATPAARTTYLVLLLFGIFLAVRWYLGSVRKRNIAVLADMEN